MTQFWPERIKDFYRMFVYGRFPAKLILAQYIQKEKPVL